MTQGALGDKFLIVSITIFLVASLLFAFFIYEDSGIGLAFGQPLTERQKARAIDIAMADPLVLDEVRSLVAGTNDTYHVRNVLGPLPFHEVGPDFDRNRSLPAVEIVVGNESEMGTNVLAYVDLNRGRVVNIGYPRHEAAYVGYPPWSRPDMSIAETRYHAGDILTGEQRDKVIRIAKEDKDVREKLRGMYGNGSFRVVGDISVSYHNFYNNNRLYADAYPVVVFREEASIYVPSFTVYATVDPDRGIVLNSFAVINTPALERSGNES